jgi:hypothetical protein
MSVSPVNGRRERHIDIRHIHIHIPMGTAWDSDSSTVCCGACVVERPVLLCRNCECILTCCDLNYGNQHHCYANIQVLVHQSANSVRPVGISPHHSQVIQEEGLVT